jgi:tetratricopeptide (TPR) repeat protein
MTILPKFRNYNEWLGLGGIVVSLALLPFPALAQTPAANAKEFAFKDFGFWAAQCRSLSAEKIYQQALTACETAISLNTEKKKVRQQQATLDLWKLRSDNLFKLEQYQVAIASYDYVLKIQPAYAEGWLHRCDALTRLRQFEPAVASCTQALTVDGDWGESNPSQAWLLQARALHQLGRFDGAIDAYDRVLAMRHNDPAIKVERCTTMIALNNVFLDTKQQLEQQQSPQNQISLPISNFPYDPAAEVATCTVALKVDQQPQVNQQPESASAGTSMTATVWYQQGKAFKLARRDADAEAAFQMAVQLYEKELSKDASDPIAWLNQGNALLQLQKYGQALASYERVTQLRPQWSSGWVGKCTGLNYVKQFEAALGACDQALQGDRAWGDDPAAIWVERGYALLGMRRYQEAIAVADRALLLSSKQARALYVRASGLWYLGDQIAAEKAIAQVEQLDDPQALFLQGRILSSLGKDKEALEAYEKAESNYSSQTMLLEQPPDHLFLADLLANQVAVGYRIETKQLSPQADSPLLLTGSSLLEIAKRALKLNPRSFEVQVNYGLTALAMSEHCPAMSAFQQALQLRPHDLYATTGMGQALAKLQRTQEAIAVLRNALGINPGYEPARAKLLELLEIERSQQKSAIQRKLQRQPRLVGAQESAPEESINTGLPCP